MLSCLDVGTSRTLETAPCPHRTTELLLPSHPGVTFQFTHMIGWAYTGVSWGVHDTYKGTPIRQPLTYCPAQPLIALLLGWRSRFSTCSGVEPQSRRSPGVQLFPQRPAAAPPSVPPCGHPAAGQFLLSLFLLRCGLAQHCLLGSRTPSSMDPCSSDLASGVEPSLVRTLDLVPESRARAAAPSPGRAAKVLEGL